eukprot:gene416-601_t
MKRSLENVADRLPRPRWGKYLTEWHGKSASGGEETKSEEIPGGADDQWGRAEEGFVKGWYEGKGWVVKGGLMYGCDYVLYRGDPDQYHSEYAVWVAAPSDSVSWMQLQGVVRLLEKVKKDLL